MLLLERYERSSAVFSYTVCSNTTEKRAESLHVQIGKERYIYKYKKGIQRKIRTVEEKNDPHTRKRERERGSVWAEVDEMNHIEELH